MAQRFEFIYDPVTGRIIPPELVFNPAANPDALRYADPDEVIGVTDGYEAWDDVPFMTITGNQMKQWDPLATKNKTIAIPGIPGIGGLSLPAFGSPNFFLLSAALIVALAAFAASFKKG